MYDIEKDMVIRDAGELAERLTEIQAYLIKNYLGKTEVAFV